MTPEQAQDLGKLQGTVESLVEEIKGIRVDVRAYREEDEGAHAEIHKQIGRAHV